MTALVESWGIRADDLRYLPKGFGSYHWVVAADGGDRYFLTVDDLDTKPWIAADRSSTFAGLGTAYDAARQLSEQQGLAFIVGALPRLDGSAVLRLSDQFSVALFPFVDGTAGEWGSPIATEDRATILRELAHLHQAKVPPGSNLLRLPLELPVQSLLLDALDALGEPWTGGPFSEPTRMALHDHQQEVRNSLTSLDALSQAVASSGPDLVITHGEPHPGNLIRTQSVVALIDWDTVALAPRERDLWMFDDGTPDALSIYEDLTEHKLNHTAMSFYRLAWELFDMASFIEMFRSAHQRSQWIEQKWVVLHGLLAGAPSDPFGLQGGVCTTP